MATTLPTLQYEHISYTIDERLREIRWTDYQGELCFASFDDHDRGTEVYLEYLKVKEVK